MVNHRFSSFDNNKKKKTKEKRKRKKQFDKYLKLQLVHPSQLEVSKHLILKRKCNLFEET